MIAFPDLSQLLISTTQFTMILLCTFLDTNIKSKCFKQRMQILLLFANYMDVMGETTTTWSNKASVEKSKSLWAVSKSKSYELLNI